MPSSKIFVSIFGAPSAYTDAGPPERISATGLRAPDLVDRRAMGDELGIDARLAHAPRDQLRVLPTEVDHEDRPFFRSRLRMELHDLSRAGN